MIYPFPLELLKAIKHLRSIKNVITFCRLRYGGFTLLSYTKMQALFEIASKAAMLDGDIVECGSYNGGSGAIMARASQKKIWMFDSFEGLPPPTKEDGESTIARYYRGWDRGSVEKVHRAFSMLGISDQNYICIKGWFQDTLPRSSITKIALLHIDADWYESVRFVLEQLYEKVQPGGYVVVDDYGHWEGCKKAIDEFIALRPQGVNLVPIDHEAVYFRKPAAAR